MVTTQQIWELWVPEVAAQGLSFARGRLDAAEVVLVHAAGARLTVEVHDDDGRVVARGANLERTADMPMARLRRTGDTLTREDIWPTEADYGTPVILAGGEGGSCSAGRTPPTTVRGAGASSYITTANDERGDR